MCNANPILITLTYDVEFEDSDVKEHIVNVIGENMLAITDADGQITMELQTTLSHRADETEYELKDKCAYVNNQKKFRKSVQGCTLEALWKD